MVNSKKWASVITISSYSIARPQLMLRIPASHVAHGNPPQPNTVPDDGSGHNKALHIPNLGILQVI